MNDLKVMYIPHPLSEVEYNNPFLPKQIEGNFNLRIYNRNCVPDPQFDNIEVIVDMGGNMTSELVGIAAQTGVKYIQVQTNGLDHVEVEEIIDSGITLAHCPGDLSSVSLAEGAMMFILMLAHGYGLARNEFFQGKVFSKTVFLIDFWRNISQGLLSLIGDAVLNGH